MKVDELRKAIEKYDAAELKEIVVSLYKAIPKNRRESDGIDELLLNFRMERGKSAKKDAPIYINRLKAEVEQFIEYADMQYYFAPNRYVRREKRSKWRFEVKRFIRDLLSVGGCDSEEAARLLASVYQMLCYACDYRVFSTENPFSAVGYSQSVLLKLVIGKIFYSGLDEAAIKKAVFLTLDSRVDRETLHAELFLILISTLRTPDAKEQALAQCEAYREEYRQEEHLNYAIELYLLLKFSLHEFDEGIRYFKKNYAERNKEAALYRLLSFMADDEFDDMWIREYESAVKKGVRPRKNLEEEYIGRKIGSAMP